jgi:hypothetical protein
VHVGVNDPPEIQVMTGLETFRSEGSGMLWAEVDVAVTAVDPDGDDLTYAWAVESCPGAELGASDPADPTKVHVRVAAAVAPGCVVTVEIRDFWPGGAPAGSGLPDARGGRAKGRLVLAGPPATLADG